MTVFSSSRKLVSATVFSPNFFSPAVGWLNLRKLVTATVFLPKMFSPAAGWLIYEFGNSFFTQKAVWKTLLSSVFETVFWVKKEFPNVTHKLISPPQAKTFSAKIRSLWQVFSNLVSPPQAKKNSGKIRSLRQVFATKGENGHWDRKIGNLIFSWKTKKKKQYKKRIFEVVPDISEFTSPPPHTHTNKICV